MARLKTIEWTGACVRLIDQTRLPMELVYEDVTTVEQMIDAIKVLKVRGAPAIGIAAAFGVYLGIRQMDNSCERGTFSATVEKVLSSLAASRPTAVNLFWALNRMKELIAQREKSTIDEIQKAVLSEAQTILEEDRKACRSIGELGFPLLESAHSILTHCNAGGLATSEYGTALAPIYIGAEKGHSFHVFADETRPLLQGARITAFELSQAGIPVTAICDNMAAWCMKQGKIDAVIVGADRIAANGDAANKIGTYGVALLAKAHSIPFYVAAPTTTFDTSLASGEEIPIEERDRMEIANGFGKQTVPDGVPVYNPAFDVTPHELISAIITEKKVLTPPFCDGIKEIM